MFCPVTREEMKNLGWDKLDVIIVSGDTYIDSSYSGSAMIGKYLIKHGFKVGIIAQPDINSDSDICSLGEPSLFWGVTAGNVDSMVANYTASMKKRHSDDMTPGGINDKRPDRASIVYANLIRRYFKSTVPLVLGGIEASLRRTTHYDYWTDSLRKPILFDAKADFLVYGMGEFTTLQLAHSLKKGEDPGHIKGIAFIKKEIAEFFTGENYLMLPDYETVRKDSMEFSRMFKLFYENNDPLTAKGLIQKIDSRYLIQNPPQKLLSTEELDEIYSLKFENKVHPFYEKMGKVKAMETIRYSLTTHRGCYGDCSFCAIAVHQGKTVVSRSKKSIINEVQGLAGDKEFKGIIHDLGGPTANMYSIECSLKISKGPCEKKSCLYPVVCKNLKISHADQIDLLNSVKRIKGIKKVFIQSGIRYDMILEDRIYGEKYLEILIQDHIGGQLKIAPEHIDETTLALMKKPGKNILLSFISLFGRMKQKINSKLFLTYYFIAAHPGCDSSAMEKLRDFCQKELRIMPEQVQIFTPTPSTFSTLQYYLEKNPDNNHPIFVEKSLKEKNRQKNTIIPNSGKKIIISDKNIKYGLKGKNTDRTKYSKRSGNYSGDKNGGPIRKGLHTGKVKRKKNK